jgi:ABC-type polysaccharide/polyol phosphate transport system ATPase subunit
MEDLILSIEYVSKKFCRSLKHSMVYGLRDFVSLALPSHHQSTELRPHEFWALNDISLQLRQGEILGVIGPNGSGKSTLLKLINGIFLPDSGVVEVCGRVGALIEVGAGFHPFLSGLENIYINGAILGMSREQIDGRLQSILEFAEIGDFLDTPVKHYSSGMYVRLGFAIAIHSDPDILLVDEALAVGDLYFKSKSFQAMQDFYLKRKGIIFVSHDINLIRRFCTRVVWIEKGHILMDGDTSEITNAYTESVNRELIRKRADHFIMSIDVEVAITRVTICDERGETVDGIPLDSDLTVKIDYLAKKDIFCPNFGIGIFTENGIRVTNTCTAAQGCSPDKIHGTGTMVCHYSRLPLMPGRYYVGVAVKDERGLIIYDRREKVSQFFIRTGDRLREENEEHGLLHQMADWSLEI